MSATTIRSVASMLIVSAAASGCVLAGKEEEPGYRSVALSQAKDPLAGPKAVVPWRPPRQMAVYVHPHEDRVQGVMIGGHWIMTLLGEGSWYFKDDPDREPVPDAEAAPEERRAALRAFGEPKDVVVPYRRKDGEKP